MDKNRKHIETVVKHAISAPKAFNVRISAILVYKNKIISFGTNQEKSHPLQAQHKRNEHSVYLHAEVDAIKNAIKQRDITTETLEKCTLYVARVKQKADDSNFYWGLAKPCDGCMSAIRTFKIPYVYYTTDEEGIFERLENN